MYTFKTHTGEQMLFHCEETLAKNLDWNERPLYPQLDHLDTTSTPGFGTKKGRKQKPVSFDGV